ncbi:efflux RND transporter periplasmic adaptor subunit [Rubinisphaera sp. JC750]|uniref:efflux RND transporter periplasmic adaptor subunit n=1 Tax=Rubinisphaera sp. JC750 TaxID=2898658 RepID=UPI001F011C06|nr:efflux RND transporter periplasmic adaptor subunit [Rubinisphaera sp. JC750]
MMPLPVKMFVICCLTLSVDSSVFAQSNDKVVVGSALISTIHSAEVPARETGVLTEIVVREGDQVERGDLLLKLDPEEAELEYERAKTDYLIASEEFKNGLRVQFAEKAAEVALAEVNRAEEANRKFSEAVSRTELERLRLVAEKAAIDHELAQHELKLLGMSADLKRLAVDRAGLLLERRLIRAPISGTVVGLAHRQGEWVEPGMTIVQILDTQRLRAEAVLAGNYRHLDLTGKKTVITMPQRDQSKPLEATGLVTFVHPKIDPVDGSFRVNVEFENRDQLFRPGDAATIRILLD